MNRLSGLDPSQLTATAVAQGIAAGTFSSEEIAAALIARIAAIDGEIQAFAHVDPEVVLAEARARDAWKSMGGRLGPLHGVPVGIKDLFDTADYPTEYGSPIFAGHRPSADAAAVRRLREAGAVVIGKTITTEFAYYAPGKTRNPHDTARTPGGSSSGSAAAVAAGLAPLALGSQTNGSVIRPASFCGVYGVKPSHGLVSRAGALLLSRKLDHVGAFARSLDDLALALDVLVGQDAADPDSRPYAAPGFGAALRSAWPLPPRLAFVRTPVWDRADADARSAIEALARELHAEEVELPAGFAGAWDAHRAIMTVDMAHNLGHHADRGPVSLQFAELIAEGRRITAVQYLAARRDAERYAEGLSGVFEQVADAIITLPAVGAAPQGLEATGDPAFCSLWSLVGCPALSLPLLTSSDDMPIGVQLIGAFNRDERLFRTAKHVLSRLGRN
ncbi:amidase [Bradyrhizobium sp. HKCCYLS2038]|uniref:amidase n=1 Tax=unclassified Bradyrhizobium TaxID=2631580 RepID=UPI003EB6ABE1